MVIHLSVFFFVLLLFVGPLQATDQTTPPSRPSCHIPSQLAEHYFSQFDAQAASTTCYGHAFVHNYETTEDLRFLPRVSLWKGVPENIATLPPTVGTEVVVYSPWPEPPSLSPDELRLQVYNTLRAASRMKGMTYHPKADPNRQKVLFKDAYRVVYDNDRPRRAPDLTVGTIPDHDTLDILQHDTTFGKGIYRITYTSDGQHILSSTTNLQRIYFTFIPVVRPRGSAVHILLIPTPDGLLSVANGATSSVVPGFAHGFTQRQMADRLVALHDWMVSNVGRDATAGRP